MAEPLEKYKAKRDFSKTKEPSGKAAEAKSAAAPSFVIQKHAARRLHYDLRLEHGGVLWSWAVTRGPSLDPSERRLAVHVEDHPIDYAGFEGTIPQGEYGGGSVIVWDNGAWVPEHDPAAMMKKGHIDFELKGEKLSGRWHLVRLKPRAGERAENWLLIKSDDEAARHDGDILVERPESIVSGLTVEAVGTAEVPVWRSNRKESETPRKESGTPRKESGTPKTKLKPANKSAKKAAAALAFVPPCLATLRTAPPAGPEWLHEVKFDGYRLQAHVSGGKVTLFTRTGLDWTPRFGAGVAGALAALPCDSVIVDGEVVVLGPNGTSSFSALQAALSEGRTDAMVFYAFDLLHLDGADITGEPLADRKEHLRDLLGAGEEETVLRYSEHFTESGQIMLEHACRLGLEGVVSKRADAPYTSGRGHDWLKSKCTQRHEFVIAGYLPSEKSGRGLRSLVMGYFEDGALKPAGNVGTGFNAATLDDLKRKLDLIPAKSSPFKVKVPDHKRIVWARPELVAEIEYRAITADGILRHASFQGLREDKPASEVVEEVAEPAPVEAKQAAKGTPPKAASKELTPSTTALALSRPDKLLWPDAGVTKQGLLDHYAFAWERMKPYVVNRPLSLVRAPDGVGGAQRFFQKHASKGMSDAIRRQRDKDGEELLFIDSFDGLAALVQMGVVEVHIWGSTMDAVEQPDQIVFDLDPDEGLGVEDVRRAALDIRTRLAELDMKSVVKVSGGKGYHVVAPLTPSAEWDEVKAFAHDFARALTQAEPERYTATLSKKARKGRIFIDYLRNGRGSTTIAPWSSRAKPQATVSVPIGWEQVETVGPADYAIGQDSTLDMLRANDPWKEFFRMGKALKG